MQEMQETQNGNPLHYSSLGNPMDRGAWQATVDGVEKNQTQLSNWAHAQHCVLSTNIIYRWGNWALVKFRDLLKVTQLWSGNAEQLYLTRQNEFNHPYS